MLNLRKADCGHWISADAEPVGAYDGGGVHSPQQVYLCEDCLARIAGRPTMQAQVETKEVKPEPDRTEVKLKMRADASAADFAEMAKDEPNDPYWQGREARTKGVNQADNPYDRRTSNGRNWHRGWAEAGPSKK